MAAAVHTSPHGEAAAILILLELHGEAAAVHT
jgi:hypothetical protein